MRHFILLAPVLSLLLSSCGGSAPSTPVDTGQNGGQNGGQPVNAADFSLSLSASSVTLAARPSC
ncbi:hypothetical protein [Deinococcus altitudinis]|uniref:hypothetical protein n=1 Tax=Deinococcus altitudinis TaxID=468914 RepID=UPI003892098E